MALTPEQIDLLADKYVVGLFQQLENEVIGDIARRVKKTGRLTETAELMAKSMVEQGYSANKIRAEVLRSMRADKALQDEIAINTKEYKQFITDEIKATVRKAKLAGNDLVADAGMMAYNNDLSMWEQAGQSLSKPNSLSQIMDAFRKQTANELRNLTKTTGFKGTVLQPVMSAYQREMDMALVKLATGTFSYDQICNDVVHNLAQSGLRTIDYASGRSYQLDTAARMSVRTGMSQLSGRITEANIESTGVDLVITSQHMGSRPEHAIWQNKVFAYKGHSKKYPDFVSSTGYGTVTGLKGANCSHDFYPYWEGISIKEPDLKEPAPVMVNGKEYDYYSATQKQRQMERNIRATKREIEAQKAIGGDTSILQANLRKQSADYHKFSADVGIRAKDNRLRVVGGSSNLKNTKAMKVHNAKEEIAQNKNQIKILEKKKKDAEASVILYGDADSQKKYNKIKEDIEALNVKNGYLSRKYGIDTDLKTIFEKQKIDTSIFEQNFSEEELSALGSWTRNGYLHINDYLRSGSKYDKKAIEEANVLTKLINRSTIKENIVVKRGTDYNALRHLFNSEDWKNDTFVASGRIIKDDGFLATTPFQTGGFGGIQMYIEVPKGAKGVYIGDYSAAKNEKELLLQKGTRMKVKELLKVKDAVGDSTYELHLEVLLNE